MRPPMKAAVIIAVLLVLPTGLGAWIYAHRPQAAPVEHVKVWLVLSPEEGLVLHDEMARQLASAFETWYKEHHGTPAVVEVEFKSFEEFRTSLAFGGLDFDVLMAGTLELVEGHEDLFTPYNSTVKEELLELVPNGTYCGCPIMELNTTTPRWYAWCFHAPCLLYDPGAFDPPSTWDELANKCLRLENALLVPDPAGDPYVRDLPLSIYAYEAWALGNESLGWARAWNITLFIWATSGNMTREPWVRAVGLPWGNYSAILCSDMIAYHIIVEAGHGWLAIRYLNGTLLRPSPILLKPRPGRVEVSRAFVDFVLSKEGQSIIAGYLMPIRPDVDARGPVLSPFSEGFPVVRKVNETFLDMASDMVEDYHECWLVKPYEDLREAWWWVRKANMTKTTNPNATKYLRWALGNFTRISVYLNRTYVDRLYNETGRWVNKTDVVKEWEREARRAYDRALENAKTFIEQAGGLSAYGPQAPSRPTLMGLPFTEDLRMASHIERALRPSLPDTRGSLPLRTQSTKCSSSILRGSSHLSLILRTSPPEENSISWLR